MEELERQQVLNCVSDKPIKGLIGRSEAALGGMK